MAFHKLNEDSEEKKTISLYIFSNVLVSQFITITYYLLTLKKPHLRIEGILTYKKTSCTSSAYTDIFWPPN